MEVLLLRSRLDLDDPRFLALYWAEYIHFQFPIIWRSYIWSISIPYVCSISYYLAIVYQTYAPGLVIPSKSPQWSYGLRRPLLVERVCSTPNGRMGHFDNCMKSVLDVMAITNCAVTSTCTVLVVGGAISHPGVWKAPGRSSSIFFF